MTKLFQVVMFAVRVQSWECRGHRVERRLTVSRNLLGINQILRLDLCSVCIVFCHVFCILFEVTVHGGSSALDYVWHDLRHRDVQTTANLCELLDIHPSKH